MADSSMNLTKNGVSKGGNGQYYYTQLLKLITFGYLINYLNLFLRYQNDT